MEFWIQIRPNNHRVWCCIEVKHILDMFQSLEYDSLLTSIEGLFIVFQTLLALFLILLEALVSESRPLYCYNLRFIK